MARKVKVVNIEGRGEVTVKEVSPYGMWLAYQEKAGGMEELTAMFNDAVTPGFDEIKTWYPSEIEQVIDAFLTVNESFFAIARKLKVDGLLVEIGRNMSKSLPELFVDSYKKVMARLPGLTAGAISSPPSKP